MEQTYNNLLKVTTIDYLNQLDLDSVPAPSVIEAELINLVNAEIESYNLGPEDTTLPPTAPIKARFPNKKPTDEKYKKIKTLEPYQIACIIAKLHGGCKIATSGINSDPDYDIIAVYQHDGPDRGTYVSSKDEIRKIARRYNITISTKEFDEVLATLRDMVPRREKCTERDLIAVNNGIFDYKNKILKDFDPEYVFMSKSHVDYVPNAKNPVITMPDGEKWDVVSWMNDLSDDKEVVTLLWEILGAIIRPHVSWNKSAWLYSEYGNNGKGTLCVLMRNLCGAGAYASVPIKDFSKDFMLEPLMRASAIIVDENDVGSYVDQAANLKAVITNDIITINRKHKAPVIFQFYGFMVQCMNEFPKIRDRSDSFYRRQLFIPMDKRFEGKERKYIKDDYLYRDDVLQYVLFHVLHETNYYTLTEPQICKDVLEAYKEHNDPTRQFFKEVEENACWTLLPFGFLYDLYKCWYSENQPNGKALSKHNFIKDIKILAESSSVYYVSDNTVRADNRMDYPEPLINEYNVTKWMNKSYHGTDANKIASPDVQGKVYRGLLRYDNIPPPVVSDATN